jgi:hypothetical protein
VFHSPGERMHQRTTGASEWAFISVAPEYLAKYGKAIADHIPAPIGQVLRPPAFTAARLRRLHAKACRLAATKTDIIAHREVARALEQDLLHALVNCLTADNANHAVITRHHTNIMVRFEEVLDAHSDQQLSLPKLCAAIGVSDRVLRICCAEMVGMSPSQYNRLRLRCVARMRQAFRGLRPVTGSPSSGVSPSCTGRGRHLQLP